jgi:hypothetical protein
MKLKLISVGIIALLVLTVVPMAVAAQPAATPVSRTVLVEPVYTWNENNPFVIGPPAGVMTFNTVSGAYACVCILHLAPNTEYWLGIVVHNSIGTITVGWIQVKTNALGYFFASGKLGPRGLIEANKMIHEGGVFAVETITF